MARAKRAAEKRRNSRTAPRGKVVNPEFPRITVLPGRMSGNPCIRDIRITVANVLQMLAAGNTQDEILAEFPYLEREDFREVLGFAAWCTGKRELATRRHLHAPASQTHAKRLAAAVAESQEHDLVERLLNAEFVEGLGRCGPAAADAVPKLVRCLMAEDRYAQGDKSLLAAVRVRRAIVLALGRIGPDADAAIPALTALRDNGDETIRVPAAQALRRIRTPK